VLNLQVLLPKSLRFLILGLLMGSDFCSSKIYNNVVCVCVCVCVWGGGA
jgi:hypothetical protein